MENLHEKKKKQWRMISIIYCPSLSDNLINSFSLSVRDERYPRGGTPKIDLDLRHLGDERGRDVVVGGPRWNLL